MKLRTSLMATSLASAILFSPFLQASEEHLEHVKVLGQTNNTISSVELVPGDTHSPDLRDALKRLAGLSGNGNGPLSAIAQYRGLFGNRVHVSVEGGPVTGAGPNAMDPPLSNVFALPGSELNLHRGIAPVSVAAQSLGGAIEIQQNADALFSEQSNWQGQLTLQHGQLGDARNHSGVLGYYSENLYLQTFALSQQRDDIEDGNGNLVPNSFYDRQMAGIAAGFRHGDHQLQGYYHKADTDHTGTAALAMDIQYIDAAIYRLSYHWQTNAHRSLTLKFHGNSNQHGMNNVDFRPSTMPQMARLNTVDSLARGYSLVWKDKLLNGNLESGLNWHTTKHNSVISNPQMENLTINNFNNVEQQLSSVYGQWDSELLDFEWLIGARYTQVKSDASDVANTMAMMNPNIGILVDDFNSAQRNLDFSFVDASLHLSDDINKRLSWQLALAQKNRAPAYTELYVWLPLGISAGLADGRNYLGNQELIEETAHQIDLGLNYRTSRLSIMPRIFYQRIDDYIVGEPSTNQTANMVSMMMSGDSPLQWQNTDATLYGADLELNMSISPTITLDMAASIVRGERDDIDEPLYRISPATLVTRLNWQSGAWSATLESELAASQTRTSSLQNETPSAGYGIVNGNLSYQFNEFLTLTGTISNLFDKAWQPHLGGVNRIQGIEQPAGERLFAEGRNVHIGLQASF
ncbi:TonB-dependent receptor plug domain-containing protein [Planctobacterium marinum]|uniref:TonB-dependent receptor-like beta-barrel domain-containing protein n=1 Tax=Planctobacterium marinum TaxID=1631968 RepID=A0AA48HN23_9ALTE|nr:hypothetical protein MACH26_03950 [Planctobacterium marinum]